MDKSAILQIQEHETAGRLNGYIEDKSLLTPLLAAPDNYGIHDLEKYLPGRQRLRGIFNTRALAAFTDYCADHDRDGAVCFVDPETMSATTVFNLGTEDDPGHCDFKACLTMKPTAEFQALQSINGQRVDQKTLAEFVEDWSVNLNAQDAENADLRIARVAMAIRAMTIEGNSKRDSDVGDYSQSRSALETVEAKSRHQLPAAIQFSCVPYEGLKLHTFFLRLSVTGGDDIRFKVQIKRMEAEVEAIGNELAENISQAMDGKALKVCVGTFKA